MTKPSHIRITVLLTSWIVLMIAGLSLSACGIAPASNAPLMVTVAPEIVPSANVELQLSDLPPGWRVGGDKTEDTSDLKRKYVWFYGTSNPDQSWINVSESIDVYSQSEQASQALQVLLTKSFPATAVDSWESLPSLEFAHHANEWKVACLPAVIEGKNSWGCKAVARYGNAVVRIMSNVFDDQWMTLNDFRAVLGAADKKLTVYSQ